MGPSGGGTNPITENGVRGDTRLRRGETQKKEHSELGKNGHGEGMDRLERGTKAQDGESEQARRPGRKAER